MAFGRLERTALPQPMSDINMTPLIDVMLVLLVIFMISAPLMTSSLHLDLPKTDAATPSDTPGFVSVALMPDGALYLGEEPLADAAFDTRIKEAAQHQPGLEVQLRADQSVPYGRVAALIGRLQNAGLNRIAFVAQPGETSTGPRR
ncbi:ExbD/TolR family protein [Methylibium sp.]|uniref:ExbD/TolR family protein n=1 Tax=Methylibium sp. TaxID=2067992 RepID=UPI003D0F3A6F